MRIVVITRFFLPDLGGAQTQLAYLARAWAEEGHQVTVLTCRWSKDWPEEEAVGGYRVVRWKVNRVRFLGTFLFVAKVHGWLRRNRNSYDVVLVSMLKHAAFAGALACRRDPFPLFLKSWGAGASGDMAWQEVANLGKLVRKATTTLPVFAPSLAVADELASAGYSTIFTVPNGVPVPDTPWNRSQTGENRRKLGWPDRMTLLTTGRFSPEKGLLDLLDAMPLILRNFPEAQLVMVGDGPQQAELEKRRSELGLDDRILMPGAVQNVEPCLRAADLYVLPSRFEGLSVALLEALVLGMPSIASDTPANQGILLQTLLPLFKTANPLSLGEIASQSLQRGVPFERIEFVRESAIERFSVARVAQAHLTVFEQAVSQGE